MSCSKKDLSYFKFAQDVKLRVLAQFPIVSIQIEKPNLNAAAKHRKDYFTKNGAVTLTHF